MLDYDIWYHSIGLDQYDSYLVSTTNPIPEYEWFEQSYSDFCADYCDHAYHTMANDQLL